MIYAHNAKNIYEVKQNIHETNSSSFLCPIATQLFFLVQPLTNSWVPFWRFSSRHWQNTHLYDTHSIYLFFKEHCQIHSMRPPPSWYQKQTIISKKKESYMQISLWTKIQKSSKRYKQTGSKNPLKWSYTTIKWYLAQGCKDSSTYANQSVWYTLSTNWRTKAIRPSQQMQEKLLTKSNTYL